MKLYPYSSYTPEWRGRVRVPISFTLVLPAENKHVRTCVKFSGRELKATTAFV
jgi:hypothetical protein